MNDFSEGIYRVFWENIINVIKKEANQFTEFKKIISQNVSLTLPFFLENL